MKNFSNILLILFFINGIFTTCEKPKTYPETPQIKFESFTIKDTIDLLDNLIKSGKLVFSFIDGDGDIGLMESDTLPPYDTSGIYYHNLFLTMHEKIDGEFQEVILAFPLNYRVPYAVPEGQNKTLKGEIKIDLTYNLPVPYDTIRYIFFLVDRALHHSNKDSTNIIVF